MREKGFSLLEVILSVAIIAILTGISVPIYLSLQVTNDTDLTSTSIARFLRRAQISSQAVDSDANWGVKIQSDSIVLFQGSSFSARNSSFDETFNIPSTITPSGLAEVVFNKMTGLPAQIGTVTLTNTINQTKTITINSKGMVDY